jgi:poly(A) polymerase
VERDAGRIILSEPPFAPLLLDFAAFRGEDLEADLRERDFTINAIAIDLSDPGKLLDPLGGAKDLLKGFLRTCSPTSFLDDPVRILRAVRLSVQFEFKILPETSRSLRAALSGLENVSAERERDEIFRILDGPSPASAIRLLDILGALNYVLPELSQMKDVRQPLPHIEDVWNHTLSALQKLYDLLKVLRLDHNPEEAANWTLGLASLQLGRYRRQLDEHLSHYLNPERSLRSLLFMAALYHDSGKPYSQSHDDKGKITFFGHELKGEEEARSRTESLHLSNREIDRICKIVRHHMRPLQFARNQDGPSRRAIYRFFRDTGAAGVDICLLSLADMLATHGPNLPQEEWIRQIEVVRALFESWWEGQTEKIHPPALINGNDLMEMFGLKPGPIIGELLESVREAQAMGKISQRDEAAKFVQDLLDQG